MSQVEIIGAPKRYSTVAALDDVSRKFVDGDR